MLNDRTDPQKETGEGQGFSSVAQQVLGCSSIYIMSVAASVWQI